VTGFKPLFSPFAITWAILGLAPLSTQATSWDCKGAVPDHLRHERKTCQASDLSGIIACYSPSKPNWHDYEVPNFELCSTAQNPKCTRELVKEAFLRNVMPCQDPSHKVQNGEKLTPNEPNTGCVFCPGHVIIHVHEEGVAAVSILTDVDHWLYDGVVLRYLKETSPGVFAVYTRGIGNNVNSLIAKGNHDGGPGIFRKQNAKMKQYLDKCLAAPGSCPGGK
jgi:hypothetical protein